MPAAVSVPITDLRREPLPSKRSYERDFLQESQLLHGEIVEILEVREGWCRVYAMQQPKAIMDGGWQGYPGWIRSEHLVDRIYAPTNVVLTSKMYVRTEPSLQSKVLVKLPFGAFYSVIRPVGEFVEVELASGQRGYAIAETSTALLERASLFLGAPYLWGGCSVYDPEWDDCNTSVDCSGLVHLVYRSAGATLPRDAKDQHRVAAIVEEANRLELGDLIFRADPENPEKIDHVMLYVGRQEVIEATMDTGSVRRIALKDKLGCSLQGLRHGVRLPAHVVYFGRVNACLFQSPLQLGKSPSQLTG